MEEIRIESFASTTFEVLDCMSQYFYPSLCRITCFGHLTAQLSGRVTLQASANTYYRVLLKVITPSFAQCLDSNEPINPALIIQKCHKKAATALAESAIALVLLILLVMICARLLAVLLKVQQKVLLVQTSSSALASAAQSLLQSAAQGLKKVLLTCLYAPELCSAFAAPSARCSKSAAEWKQHF
jgi:hypothetical protein